MFEMYSEFGQTKHLKNNAFMVQKSDQMTTIDYFNEISELIEDSKSN